MAEQPIMKLHQSGTAVDLRVSASNEVFYIFGSRKSDMITDEAISLRILPGFFMMVPCVSGTRIDRRKQ